ncbi:MAG TPA: sulfotransferase [Anaerolineales bacterium]|nr:sulfotransferase [Anaerolineales bacterium]
MALKVIGAGFGRTGTLSLKTALEELGFGKCYHMVEALRRPSHWQKWTEIMQGGKADWEALFKGYQAAVDWPAAAYYRDLMALYPEAKVILTVRDPNSWHRSMMTTIYQARRQFVLRLMQMIPALHRFFIGMEKVVWEGIFHSKVEDKAHAEAVFERHNEEVKRVVPAERLLIFEAKQGWEPLCSFLNVPVPVDKPYPHKHKGDLVRNFLKYTHLTEYR